MKKILKYSMNIGLVGATIAPVAAVVSCGGAKDSTSPVYAVSDGGNKLDHSFNEQAYDAARWFSGSDKHFIDSDGKTDGIGNSYKDIDTRDSLGKKKTIIAAGFKHGDAIKAYTGESRFILIDYVLTDDKYNPIVKDNVLTPIVKDNVLTINFKTSEVGFEAGYAAAKKAYAVDPTDPKVATFGSAAFDSVTNFMYGFAEGVKYYNTNTKKVELVKDSNDAHYPIIGDTEFKADKDQNVSNLAKALINDGVDVIFPVGGPQQETVATTIQSEKKEGKVFVIGVDADFAKAKPEFQNEILTSALKNIALATTAALQVIYGEDAGATAFDADKYQQITTETRAVFTQSATGEDLFGKSVLAGIAEGFVGLAGDAVLGDAAEIADVKAKAAESTATNPKPGAAANFANWLKTFNETK